MPDRYRTGTSIHVSIYRLVEDDPKGELMGFAMTPEKAAELVAAANGFDGMAAVARRYRDGWYLGDGGEWWRRPVGGELVDIDGVIEHEPVTAAEAAALDALEGRRW